MRNTPTSVGKTHSASPSTASLKKHPHERGEDEFESWKDSDNLETPPRAWGRLTTTVTTEDSIRNTPTSVGKTNA